MSYIKKYKAYNDTKKTHFNSNLTFNYLLLFFFNIHMMKHSKAMQQTITPAITPAISLDFELKERRKK